VKFVHIYRLSLFGSRYIAYLTLEGAAPRSSDGYASPGLARRPLETVKYFIFLHVVYSHNSRLIL
jgi:hypothetical protein